MTAVKEEYLDLTASDEALAAQLARQWDAEDGRDPASSQNYYDLTRIQEREDAALARRLALGSPEPDGSVTASSRTMSKPSSPPDVEEHGGEEVKKNIRDEDDVAVAAASQATPAKSITQTTGSQTSTTSQPRPRNAFDLMRQASSTKPKIQAYNYKPSRVKSELSEATPKKRKLEELLDDAWLISDDDEDDLKVIPKHDGYAVPSPQVKNESYHRSQSHHNSAVRPTSNGSIHEPILVENDDPVAGPSRSQHNTVPSQSYAAQHLFGNYVDPAQPWLGTLPNQDTKTWNNYAAYMASAQALVQSFNPAFNYLANMVMPNHTPTYNPYAASNLQHSRFNQYQEAYSQQSISEEDLKNLLDNIKDIDIPADQREGNPVGLTKTLLEHQKVGLTWLRGIEEGTNKGGILADAMGYV